jgi:spermidine synthase
MNPRQPALPGQSPATAARLLPKTLHVLLFVSGALALVYEILWMRRFAAVFGATTPAVAATLAAVFFGFTMGSFVIGARAARWARPLRAYGWLEIIAGIGALLVEPLLAVYDRVYPGIYQALSGSPAGFAAVKTVLAAVALFLPTFCMGGTVPLLGQALGQGRRLGISAGGLYGANTLGAAIGAFSVPFFWLPHLSARASYGVCVAGSLLIGFMAGWLDARAQRNGLLAAEAARIEQRPPMKTAFRSTLSLRFLLTLSVLSGASLFILQVVWSQMFAQVHENSIYSFSVVVAVLLAGLAGGAALARHWLRAGRSALRGLAWAWIVAGAVVLVSPNVFFALTKGLSYIEGHGGWTAYGLRLLWLTLPTVLAPTLLAGMALPLLMEMTGHATEKSSGRVLGWLIGANTAGAIAGALIAAFVLPATVGLWMSLALVGVLMIVAGDFCLFHAGTALAFRLAYPVVVIAAFLLLRPDQLPRTKFRAHQGEVLLALKEGSHGIVAVVEKGPSRRIKLNNYYVLGGTASTGDERLQGHLPLLLHPTPRRVAFLGLGTGITAGAALLHPVEHITAIEMVPEVITVAREHFAQANLRVLDSLRVDVVAEDARNYLLGSTHQFDVIVGDLFVPWHRGESSLYTADHFTAARHALAPGGIFCQWLPLFQLSEEEFNIVTATFLDVFPHATLWRGDFAPDAPAVALVGQLDATALDPAVIDRRLHEMNPDDANPALVHPAGFWMLLGGSLERRDERFVRARRNRENEPWLEILGPLNHAGSARGAAPLFVGRRLETFLDELRARPLSGTLLSRLPDEVVRWRTAGAKLAEASILTFENRQNEGETLLKQTVRTLPPEIHGAVGGAASSSTNGLE